MSVKKKNLTSLIVLGIFLATVVLLLSNLSIINSIQKKDMKKNTTSSFLAKGTDEYKRGNFAKAIDIFKKLVSQRPKDPEAHYRLGMAYEGAGKIDEAIIEYEKATKLDSKMTQAHYQLGIAYRSKGKDKAATRALEESVRLAPDLGSARLMLAQMYAKDNRIDEAIKQYKALLELKLYGMNLADIHNELGLLYVKKGDIERAKSEWNSSLTIDPNNVRAKELLSKY